MKRSLLRLRSPSTNTHTTCLTRPRMRAVVVRRALWIARTSRSPRRSRLVILTSNRARCVRCTGTRMLMNGECNWQDVFPWGASDTDIVVTGRSSSRAAHVLPSSLPKATRAHSTTWQAMSALCHAIWATLLRTSAMMSRLRFWRSSVPVRRKWIARSFHLAAANVHGRRVSRLLPLPVDG